MVPPGADVDPAHNCVSASSLAKLQGDIATRFPSFDQARKAVVPHLLDDSWVTIRACNIGKSAEAMYALHAFFGGRTDVYAPIKYMVVGDCIIRPGSGYRIETKFGIYEHLVKQHFLSSWEHTPKRQAAIVTDLINPESFSVPFRLATAQLTGGDPDQASAHQQLVAGLDKYGISAELKTAFATAGHPLSANTQVVSANDIPIDKRIKPSDPSSVWYVRDTAIPEGTWTGGTNDIAAGMNSGLINASFDPLPDPLPPIQLRGGEDYAWIIPVTPPINVEVELEAAPDGSPLHTIIAQVDMSGPALDDWHRGAIQTRRAVPHTPGTEIAAYLDRYTADELAAFIV